MGPKKRDSRTEPMSERPFRRASKLPLWKKALFSFLATLAFFLALEIFLFACGVTPVLYEEDPYVGFSSHIPLFVEQTRADGTPVMVTAGNKIRFFNAQQFPREKEPRTRRVFCLGGSTTYGRPYDDRTSFCGWLRAFLSEADPARKWEVINAGGISYASYRVALLMEELIRYEPDLFIIYSGHNEFLERRTYGQIMDMPSAVPGLVALLSRSRTYAAMKRAVRGESDTSSAPTAEQELLPREVETLLDETIGPAAYTRDDALQKQVLAHYRYNLARMIDIARAADARVIMVAPASNLRDCSPFKSEHRADLSEAGRRRCQILLESARQEFSAGRLEGALRLLEEAITIDDRHADLHYLHGRVLDGLERHGEAKTAFSRARDEDVCPLRALSPIRQIIAEVSEERNVPLVDFVALVEGRSAQGIPGENLFLDHVHPTIEGNRLLALSLLEEMARQGHVTPARSWNETAIQRVRERVESGLDRRSHGIALKNLAKVLGWAGKFEDARRLGLRAMRMVPDDAECHFTLGVAFERLGDFVEATARYERAIGLEPDYAEAHKNLGRVYEKQGDLAKAAAYYKQALRIRSDYAEARANLGNVLANQGDLSGAVTHLETVLRLEPANAEAHQKLGVVFLKQRNLARASHHLEAALRIRPDYARAHNNLGLVFAEQGKLSSAAVHYEHALQIDPDYLSAHDNLGNLFANQGKIAQAVAHFEQVLRIEPDHAGVHRKLRVMAARFEQVLRSKPGDAEAHYYLGLVLGADGNTLEAVAHCRKALELARASGQAELAGQIRARLELYRTRPPGDGR